MHWKKTAIIVLLIVLSWSRAGAVVISIAYEHKEQPPYYMGNTSTVLEKDPGVAVEMVLMLEQKVDGVKIILTRAPWKRCTISLKSNRVDGIFNASYKKSRLEIGWYPTTDKTHQCPVDTSRRITTISYSFYTLKGSGLKWDGDRLENLKGHVSAPLGYSIVGDLKEMGIPVEEAPSSQNNLVKLIRKRVTAVALQDVTADSIIKADQKTYENIIKLDPPLKTKPYYLMLSKAFVSSHPRLSQKIWDAIKVIRKTKMKEMVAKYAVGQ